MTPFELQKALNGIIVTVDTREQDTPSLRRRLKEIGFPFERRKLNFGDYSCMIELNGEICDLSHVFAVERKMDIDELATCMTSQRKRFTAEFERAKEEGAKIYLLTENGTLEKILNNKYRSKVNPNALLASVFAFLARYNCQMVFCRPESTGRIIREIVYREAKKHLEENSTHLQDFSKKYNYGE